VCGRCMCVRERGREARARVQERCLQGRRRKNSLRFVVSVTAPPPLVRSNILCSWVRKRSGGRAATMMREGEKQGARACPAGGSARGLESEERGRARASATTALQPPSSFPPTHATRQAPSPLPPCTPACWRRPLPLAGPGWPHARRRPGRPLGLRARLSARRRDGSHRQSAGQR